MDRTTAYLLSEGKQLSDAGLMKLRLNAEIMAAAAKGRKEITTYFSTVTISRSDIDDVKDYFLLEKKFDTSISCDFGFGLSLTISWH